MRLTLLLLFGMLSQGQTPVPLWPGGVPGKPATSASESDTTKPQDAKPGGQTVVRLANVTQPSITYFAPAQANSSRQAIIVFPGGGYHILAYDLEGTEVCRRLTAIGLHAFLVKYRVPQPEGTPRFQQPLADAMQAMRYVQGRAREIGYQPTRIGVLGFSAGGHLCATLSNSADLTIRPAFAVLIYPAYLSVNDEGKAVAPEVAPRDTPPTFIVQTEDDLPFVPGTLLYYQALLLAKRPAEMHLYSKGGHGYGLRQSTNAVTTWPALLETWLAGINPAQ